LRLTSGNIVRAAQLARASQPPMAKRTRHSPRSRRAVRSLERPGLEALARRCETRSWLVATGRVKRDAHRTHDARSAMPATRAARWMRRRRAG
jgi:hypothetical protein